MEPDDNDKATTTLSRGRGGKTSNDGGRCCRCSPLDVENVDDENEENEENDENDESSTDESATMKDRGGRKFPEAPDDSIENEIDSTTTTKTSTLTSTSSQMMTSAESELETGGIDADSELFYHQTFGIFCPIVNGKPEPDVFRGFKPMPENSGT